MTDAVRACPNCGSTDLGHDSLSVVSRLSLSGGRACRDCGYAGIFPEMAAEDVDDFDGADGDVSVRDTADGSSGKGRLLIGAILLLLGLGASSYATWGNGLLAGLLAIAVGAGVLADQLTAGSTMEK